MPTSHPQIDQIKALCALTSQWMRLYCEKNGRGGRSARRYEIDAHDMMGGCNMASALLLGALMAKGISGARLAESEWHTFVYFPESDLVADPTATQFEARSGKALPAGLVRARSAIRTAAREPENWALGKVWACPSEASASLAKRFGASYFWKEAAHFRADRDRFEAWLRAR